MEKFIIRRIAAVFVLLFGFHSLAMAQGSQELQLLATFNGHSAAGYNDCWGYTAPDGREYALLGVQNGTSIIDITDPANLVEIDFIPSANSSWKDIKTYQHYAYAVNESGGGLQIFDLSNLPNGVTVLPSYTGFSTSHNIYIDTANAILYAEGSFAEPVRALSLADPQNPVPLSSFGIECHDIYARNNIVYVSEGNSGSIGIYDLSTPTNPVLLSRINVPNSGYVHNAWLSDDGNYLMSTEETGGKTIKLWDISNLSNAFITDEYLGGSSLAHNTHIKGDYAYISHYESGLKVVDISDPNNIFEVGYYDTYPQGEGPNFNGAWGAFPFFSSGKVLISDIQSGLYVVYFEGAVDADPLDPNPPENFEAYSYYSTPTSMLLTWGDPTTYFNGDPLSPSEFTIEVERDGSPVASVPGGTETYTDMGLTTGTLYEYVIYAKITATDSISREASASWIAGGSPVPAAPTNLTLTNAGGGMLKAKWTNPAANDDGTPLVDFDAINLYENGILINTFNRSASDTGKADSAIFTPNGPNRPYHLTALDNESPSNESVASNTAFPPFTVPYLEDFESATPGEPGTLPQQWTNEGGDDFDWYVNQGGTPSSGTGPNVDHTTGTATGNYMYTEATSPNNPNKIALLTTPFVDISGVGSPSLVFWYHMHGSGMGELHVDVYANGTWNLDAMTPLVGQQQPGQNDPWQQRVVDLSSYSSSGAVQVRFRGITGSSFASDMAIDDVFIGELSADPQMVVTPQSISDTLLVGQTAMHTVHISNVNPLASILNYTITENPPVNWVEVSPTSGSLSSGESDQATATINSAGLAPGSYTTQIVVAGNDPNNPQHEIAVNLEVVDAPVIAVSPDTVHFALAQNQVDSLPIMIYNLGGGPLQIFSIEDEDVVLRGDWTPAYTQPPKPTVYEQKGASATGSGEVIEGEGGPDPFGYSWIDSDEPTGPAYSFTDISGTGTVAALQPTGTFDPKDEGMATISLPFSVNFYGTSYNQVQVNSNGFVTFDMSFFANAFTNQGIPNSSAPNLYAAPFWDDLDGSAGGNIYYEQIGNRFIIQWHNWGYYPSGTENLIFQVVLFQNSSTIWFVYENMVDQGGSTVGIENGDGSAGLEIAYNQAYAHNQLLTKISLGADWLSENPTSGTIAPGDSLEVILIADAANLQDGAYHARLVIESNDPVNPQLKAPFVTLDVGVTGVETPTGLPASFALKANYPNPFNPTTTIAYQVPRPSDVRIEIYNMLGQKVRTLLNDRKEPGEYKTVWDGRNDGGAQVASGVYMYRMVAGDFMQVRKMILMR